MYILVQMYTTKINDKLSRKHLSGIQRASDSFKKSMSSLVRKPREEKVFI